MDEYLLVTDTYGQVHNFQLVFVTKSIKYPRKKVGRKFDDFSKLIFSWKKLVWSESSNLAESKYVLGFMFRRHWAKNQPDEVDRLTASSELSEHQYSASRLSCRALLYNPCIVILSRKTC